MLAFEVMTAWSDSAISVPPQARTIEMPAGLVGDIHAGESIEVSAVRELEESGLRGAFYRAAQACSDKAKELG